jgi:aspartate/tyrosine/aromatic aminotransferase
MSFFEGITAAPADAIFGINAAFEADARKTKVNLCVGVYRAADLQTKVMDSVKKAEELILKEEKNKDYLPILGGKSYLEHIGSLIFGEKLWKNIAARTCSTQSVGGTGALRIGGEFLFQEVGKEIYISDPTWPNHRGIFTRLAMKVGTYPYYERHKRSCDFEKMYAMVQTLPEKSILLLHACCHNPTGSDLSPTEWKELSSLMLKRKLLPFFDIAYQGLGKGWDEDAYAVRLFAEEGHEMLVAASFSKNFSLYAERVGALFVISQKELFAQNAASQIKILVRTNYSNPPLHGAKIVATILSSPSLKKEWEAELTQIRERIVEIRKALTAALSSRAQGFDFSYLDRCHGLFSFCDLTKEQVDRLKSEYGIYTTSDGRINITGLNWDNLDYVADAIAAVI